MSESHLVSERTREEERAKRLMAMGQMAASLAHEIRNPLGSMELYCSLLKKDLAGSPATFELADNIHQGIKTLDRIISNCLQFTRDVTPRCSLVTDTTAMFKQVSEYVRPKVDSAPVVLEVTQVGSEPIWVDTFLVQQALVNVAMNAVEAALDRDRPQVRMLSDRRNSDVWYVSIEDNGQGIPAADRERIFDPFVTTKRQGNGLGLAVVHSIVCAHQGAVTIESELGMGTTVTLSFPRANLESAGRT